MAQQENRLNGTNEPAPAGLRVVMVGVGTMSPGIAVDYLLAGHQVTLLGRDAARVAAALERTRTALNFLTTQQAIDQAKHELALQRLRGGVLEKTRSAVPTLEEAEIVVESVAEVLETKQNLFHQLETIVSPQTLLLTNTSGLSISEIAEPLKHPERVLGTHYWNPAYLMPLVEVTAGKQTAPEIVDRVCRLLTEMGKHPVRVKKERPGLIWNRLQFALLRECLHILQEGVAEVEELDLVVEQGLARRWSFIGPFKTSDLGGQDVFLTIARYLYPALATDQEPPAFWQEMVERGETGLKQGQGFYKWNKEDAADLLHRRDEYLLRLLLESKKQKDEG
jgi:3-hydroxybutyryl-CoA dehydrogenase